MAAGSYSTACRKTQRSCSLISGQSKLGPSRLERNLVVRSARTNVTRVPLTPELANIRSSCEQANYDFAAWASEWQKHFLRIASDHECMGHDGLPSTRARSLFVASLPARPGHSRDTPVTETTCTYSRHLGQVERQTPEIPSSRRSAFCNLWRLWNREKVSAVPPGISYDCAPLVSAIGSLCISVMMVTDGWVLGFRGRPALYAIVMFA